MTGPIAKGRNYRSAQIGGVTVFTYEGAEAAYKSLAKRVYSNLTMESSVALGYAGDQMHRLGYTWDQIEAFELEAAHV